jgi:hypothetical protein
MASHITIYKPDPKLTTRRPTTTRSSSPSAALNTGRTLRQCESGTTFSVGRRHDLRWNLSFPTPRRDYMAVTHCQEVVTV